MCIHTHTRTPCNCVGKGPASTGRGNLLWSGKNRITINTKDMSSDNQQFVWLVFPLLHIMVANWINYLQGLQEYMLTHTTVCPCNHTYINSSHVMVDSFKPQDIRRGILYPSTGEVGTIQIFQGCLPLPHHSLPPSLCSMHPFQLISNTGFHLPSLTTISSQ